MPTVPGGIIIDRFEDTTALVGDLVLTSPGGLPAIANATVMIALNEPVASQVLTLGGATLSDALLNLNDTTVPGSSAVYAGAVNGSTITFSSVALPANDNYTITFQNIRVNAHAAPSSNGFAITEGVVITSEGFLNYASPSAVQVGIVEQGFSVPALTAGTNVLPYTTCVGNPTTAIDGTTNTYSFQITVKELFNAAFKTKTTGGTCGGISPCQVTAAEQGSNTTSTTVVQGTNALIGQATHGTRFQLSFANVPQNVTIYLPLTLANAGNTLVLTLTGTATGIISPVAAGTPAGWLGAPSAPYRGSSNGTVTAFYEVTTADNTVSNLSFNAYGYVTAPPGFTTAPTAPIMVTIVPAPVAGAGVTDIPAFAPSTNPVLTLNMFSICQTVLLFPYVSNELGFDTGIAIANTGVDPFGTLGAQGGSPGTCTLSFYGTGAPYPNVAVPPPAPFPAQLQPGTAAAFLLSQVAIGFQGYIIAQCNFLYAHGFAYLSDEPGRVSLPYLASVIPPDRAAAEAANNFESLGN
ncbi:MAG: hypothetical protein ABSB15_02660 [Bryobacteraceae bacterium]